MEKQDQKREKFFAIDRSLPAGKELLARFAAERPLTNSRSSGARAFVGFGFDEVREAVTDGPREA